MDLGCFEFLTWVGCKKYVFISRGLLSPSRNLVHKWLGNAASCFIQAIINTTICLTLYRTNLKSPPCRRVSERVFTCNLICNFLITNVTIFSGYEHSVIQELPQTYVLVTKRRNYNHAVRTAYWVTIIIRNDDTSLNSWNTK